MKLEYVESLALAHPFIKGFEQVSYCLTDEEVRAVAQGEISEAIAKRKKEDIEGVEGGSAVYSTTFYIGLVVEPRQRTSSPIPVCVVTHPCLCEAGSVGPRRLDISYPTTEFTKLVKMWEKFDENKMGIVVRHIRRYTILRFPLPTLIVLASAILPDYVFDEGERQPRLAQKRPNTKVCKFDAFKKIPLTSILHLHKTTDRFNNTSPDVPNKKARLVQNTTAPFRHGCMLMLYRHSMSETSAVVPPHEALKNAENGINSLPHINTATVVERPPSSAAAYKSPIKEPSQIKSPQLPRGENVAVATATVP